MDRLRAYLSQSLIIKSKHEEGYTDVAFMSVRAKPEVKAEEFKELLNVELLPLGLNLFDNEEHSYIEIGSVVGDQDTALRLMGLGTELHLWQLLTPKTMLKIENDSEIGKKMAGLGMVTILVQKTHLKH